MTFQPKAALPGLKAEQARAIIEQFRAVAAELTALGIPAETVSELIASNRVAEVGELVRCCPPAADMQVLLPPATEQNKGDSIRLAVESVASGGQVNVAVIGGQLMNGAATVAITTVGMNEFTSLGPSGWSFLAAGGGGGGESLAATLLIGASTGGTDVDFTGGSELRMAADPGTLGEVLTSGGAGVSPTWGPAGGATPGWDDVLLVDATSGASNPIVNVGQFMQFGLVGPTTSSPQIRSGDATFRISGSGQISVIGGTNVALAAQGGAFQATSTTTGIISAGTTSGLIGGTGCVMAATTGNTDISASAGAVNLAASTFVSVNNFLRFIEQAASTPALAATQGLFWVRNDTPNVPMFTDDTNVDHVLAYTGAIAGHVIRDDGVDETQRAALNFVSTTFPGVDMVGTDDAGSNETEISASIAAMAANTIAANATAGSAAPTAVALAAQSAIFRAAGNITTAAAGASTIFGRAAAGDLGFLTASALALFTGVTLQSFTASGTYTPTTGMKFCIVITTGSGGGGGGSDGTNATAPGDAGGGSGGGAGGTCIEFFSAATIGASQTVTIGSAGTAGSATNGTSGGAGGNSTFGALHTANGGGAGAGTGVVTLNINKANGGAGGVPSGGTLNITGGDGADGFGISSTATNGTFGIGRGGAGGVSFWGGGGNGGVATVTTGTSSANASGNVGKAFGSGGGGGGSIGTTGGAGAAGLAGCCLVIEFT